MTIAAVLFVLQQLALLSLLQRRLPKTFTLLAGNYYFRQQQTVSTGAKSWVSCNSNQSQRGLHLQVPPSLLVPPHWALTYCRAFHVDECCLRDAPLVGLPVLGGSIQVAF
jgi:hypothetical protein